MATTSRTRDDDPIAAVAVAVQQSTRNGGSPGHAVASVDLRRVAVGVICLIFGVSALLLCVTLVSTPPPVDTVRTILQCSFNATRVRPLKCPAGPPQYAYYSQGTQDATVFSDFYSDPRRCFGTFLDVGALDGRHGSNSLFFEETLGWHGLCIEAHPGNFTDLVSNRPRCVNIQCVASNATRGAAVLTGGNTRDAEHPTGPVGMAATCRLDDLLAQYNLWEIDYMSLGGELDALRGIDFDTFLIKIVTVKVRPEPPAAGEPVRSLLHANGFRLHKVLAGTVSRDAPDELWVNNAIFPE